MNFRFHSVSSKVTKLVYIQTHPQSYLEVDFTTGVRPFIRRLRDLLMFTTLKMIRWFSWVFSMLKKNQNLCLGLQVSGRM